MVLKTAVQLVITVVLDTVNISSFENRRALPMQMMHGSKLKYFNVPNAPLEGQVAWTSYKVQVSL
jgi:hypothetical protein